MLLGGLGLLGYYLYAAASPGTGGILDPIASGGVTGSGGTDWLSTIFGGGDGISSMTAPTTNDVDVLARTLYGEARGDGIAGMTAVANVVMNRVAAGHFPGGTSIAGVCQAPWQFSCWNANDPNLPVIQNVTDADPVFAQALQIAQAAVGGSLGDTTGGATYYVANSLNGGAAPAAWGQVTETAQIGNQTFYA